MAADLLDAYPAARSVFDGARERSGTDFEALCREGPEEVLNSTRISQPAIFLHSMAVLEVLGSRAPFGSSDSDRPRFCQGVDARAAAGLSLGEYSALVFVGSLEFEDALRIVCKRGEFMQKACDAEPGSMLSILGLGVEKVEAIVEGARADGLRVGVANYNSPQQVVISGAEAAVEEAGRRMEAAGAKRTVRLTVAGAYHSELMAPATVELEPLLRDVTIRAPRVPFYSNTFGKEISDPEEIREGLIRQVESSVRWHQILGALSEAGLAQAYEIGPGKVIRGLVRTVSRDVKVTAVGTCADVENLI